MELTNNQIAYVYSQKWDEDCRQDALLAALEYEGEVKHYRTWISTVYNNLLKSARTKEARRQELAAERHTELEALISHHDLNDPVEYLEAEALANRVSALSPVLSETLLAYLEGTPVEEIAKGWETTENTIYQRIYQAKKEITNG
jgi:RNA polymerase sigma factor (sigma-70 family)